MAEGPSFHAENSFFQETLETGGHLGDFKHSHSYFLKSSNPNKEGEHAGFGSGFLRTASFDHRKGVTVDGRDFCELNLFALRINENQSFFDLRKQNREDVFIERICVGDEEWKVRMR